MPAAVPFHTGIYQNATAAAPISVATVKSIQLADIWGGSRKLFGNLAIMKGGVGHKHRNKLPITKHRPERQSSLFWTGWFRISSLSDIKPIPATSHLDLGLRLVALGTGARAKADSASEF